MGKLVDSIKHDGAQEALRKKVCDLAWEIKSQAEGIHWSQEAAAKKRMSRISAIISELVEIFEAIEKPKK